MNSREMKEWKNGTAIYFHWVHKSNNVVLYCKCLLLVIKRMMAKLQITIAKVHTHAHIVCVCVCGVRSMNYCYFVSITFSRKRLWQSKETCCTRISLCAIFARRIIHFRRVFIFVFVFLFCLVLLWLVHVLSCLRIIINPISKFSK